MGSISIVFVSVQDSPDATERVTVVIVVGKSATHAVQREIDKPRRKILMVETWYET